MRHLLLTAAALLCTLTVTAQQSYTETRFDESDGLSQTHTTQILQDPDGLLWVATWNGLNRFDGYEFVRIAPQAGDGCSMSTDRIRNIWLSASGDLFCLADETLFRFDRKTYRFHDTTDGERKEAERMLHQHAGRGKFINGIIEFTDRQGMRWQLRHDAIYRLRPYTRPAQPLPQQQSSQTRCIARDRQGRIWVSTKEDATVRVYDNQLQFLGYLRPDGRFSQQYTSFGQPIYCITPTDDGSLWLGSKPGGLYHLHDNTLEHIGPLPCDNIYDILPDRWGRLWLATLGGGLVCRLSDGSIKTVLEQPFRMRYLHLTKDDVLLATTTEGLVVTQLKPDLQDMTFHIHRREAHRPSSLTCNATMDILETSGGRLLISTESGGVCEVVSPSLMADTLSFRRLPVSGGWATDVILSIATDGHDHLLMTSSNMLFGYDLHTGLCTAFDASFFAHDYRFSEVQPLWLGDGRWLIGSMEDCFILRTGQMHRSDFCPPIILTGISIQGGLSDLAVNDLDTLMLRPDERSLTIRFAALDYTNASTISYAFRLGDDDTPWNQLGHDHTVTLLDLKPGTYSLWLHSTNSDGVWTPNERRLTIVVQPRFTETAWFTALLILVLLAVASGITYTTLYIRRLKRQQHETLAQYLALLEKSTSPQPQSQPQPQPLLSAEDDAFMQRAVRFVEENLGNADADVGQMAEACAVSRSGLQRKLKQLVGLTPLDFLREARIKHACQLLRQSDNSIADIAYHCGFNDPKYFSRAFKQTTGQSPTEYKEAL